MNVVGIKSQLMGRIEAVITDKSIIPCFAGYKYKNVEGLPERRKIDISEGHSIKGVGTFWFKESDGIISIGALLVGQTQRIPAIPEFGIETFTYPSGEWVGFALSEDCPSQKFINRKTRREVTFKLVEEYVEPDENGIRYTYFWSR